MKKTLITIIEVLLLLFIFIPKPVHAELPSCENIYDLGLSVSPNIDFVYPRDGDAVSFTITDSKVNLDSNKNYRIILVNLLAPLQRPRTNSAKPINNQLTLSRDVPANGSFWGFDYTIELKEEGSGSSICKFNNKLTFTKEAKVAQCELAYTQTNPSDKKTYTNPSCVSANIPVSISILNASYGSTTPTEGLVQFNDSRISYDIMIDANGSGNTEVSPPAPNNYTLKASILTGATSFNECASVTIKVKPSCTPEEQEVPNNQLVDFDLCQSLKSDNDKYQQCDDCLKQQQGVWTALGCIRFSPENFVTDFLRIALGIAGGIALLLMIYGSFLISTSAGDPKKAEEGKEIITGTIAGLLFIIFSVFLLKLIGVDILQIPGL